MPSLSDHTRRDAEHALRSAVQVEVGRYVRRMIEHGKGHIKEEIERATQTGRTVDGTALGQDAATSAITAYIGGAEPQAAIDAPASEVEGSGHGDDPWTPTEP